MPLFRQNTYLLIWKLPAIGNIPFATNVAFITIKKVYQACFRQLFQFCQLLDLVVIPHRARLCPTSFPYALVSSANTFKKRRSVSLLADLPLWDSHSALAVCNRCRLAFTDAKTEASSLLLSIKGLRPLPGFVSNPAMPSVAYRNNQLFTLISHIFTIPATSLDLRFSDLRRTNWHLSRKACFLPLLKPSSKAVLASVVNCGVFTRPMGQNYKII